MKALDRGHTPTITPDLIDELFVVQVDADGVARDGRASIGTLLDATASSRYGLVANEATGVAATDTAHLQSLLDTGRDVKLRRTATAYAINDTLTIAGSQELDGDYAQINFSHAGTAIAPATPGVRSYWTQIRRLVLVGPGVGVADSLAIDMDSMSLATIDEVTVNLCHTAVRLWSSISGGCVYNKVGIGVASCTRGVIIEESSNENRIMPGSVIGGTLGVGVQITDANRTTVTGVAMEGNAIGVDLVATSADLCIVNNVTDNRFEGNTIAVRVGSLVKDTRVLENGFTGSGTFLQDRGLYTVCDDRRVTNAQTPYAKRAAVYFTGATGNYASTPDVAALDITGDLFLSAELALDDWTPAAVQNVLNKIGSGQNSYRLYVAGTTGKVGLLWTADGSTFLSHESTVAPTIANAAWLHIAAHLDVDNGASGHTVTFLASVDGATWDPLGTPVVTAGTTSVFSGTAGVYVGVSNDGASGPIAGKVASATIRSGSATGSVAARFDAAALQGSARMLDSTNKVWTMTGSAWCSTLY